jgi:tRNA modification GTPase
VKNLNLFKRLTTSRLEVSLTVSTIIALASGQGPAGVSIIRVSGPEAGSVVRSLAGSVPAPRQAVLRTLIGDDGETIDRALVLWFPLPQSFTGEDVVEFHVHGGRAVVVDVLEACLALPHVVLAKAGEFTRRAFENGKMDLSAAEGLSDLIEAETKAQRRQALRQMEGALAHEVLAWRESIIDALADAEGDIDFPDEDLPHGLNARARLRIAGLRDQLVAHLADSDRAVRVRDGFRVAIVGAPNAGKSSLLNRLAQREAAIVSPIPGTTRDIVEVRLILDGMVIWVADTAGLREAEDQIEAEGISRALSRAQCADLRLGVIASEAERGSLASVLKGGDIWVLAKADEKSWVPQLDAEIALSSLTGEGVEALEDAIIERARLDLSASETAPLTRLRHKEAVVATIAALDRALGSTGDTPELVAEDLRLAVRHLGEIIGRVDMEDVLDRLFSQFCIGK